jgi:hypothetical protein
MAALRGYNPMQMNADNSVQYQIATDSMSAFDQNMRKTNIFTRVGDWFWERPQFLEDATNVLSQHERSMILNGHITSEDVQALQYMYQTTTTDPRIIGQLSQIFS